MPPAGSAASWLDRVSLDGCVACCIQHSRLRSPPPTSARQHTRPPHFGVRSSEHGSPHLAEGNLQGRPAVRCLCLQARCRRGRGREQRRHLGAPCSASCGSSPCPRRQGELDPSGCRNTRGLQTLIAIQGPPAARRSSPIAGALAPPFGPQQSHQHQNPPAPLQSCRRLRSPCGARQGSAAGSPGWHRQGVSASSSLYVGVSCAPAGAPGILYTQFSLAPFRG